MSNAVTTARPRPFAAPVDAGGLIDRMPPHDLSCEAGTLGSVIIDPDPLMVLGAVRMLIPTPETFFKEENQIIFRVLCEIADAGRKIDAMILRAALQSKNLLDQVGGHAYIVELANTVPHSSNAAHYAAVVAQKSKIRELITACTTTLRDCYESGDDEAQILDRHASRIYAIAERTAKKHPKPMSQILPAYLERLDEQHRQIAAGGATTFGLATGLIELDGLTGGLQNGEMILLAARPSVGKSALAFNVVEHVGINLKRPCAVFSLEMADESLALRLLSSRSGINSNRIRRGEMNASEKQHFGAAAADCATPTIFIDDSPNISLTDLRTKAMRLRERHKIELLVVDYLGLMQVPQNKGRQDNRVQEVSAISLGLKNLARELNIPTVVLSQLNRKCEEEQRVPRISDLRDSGSLEQDADLILLLHREAMLHRGDPEWARNNPEKVSEAQLIVGKQRNGAVDVVKLTYLEWCTRFTNYNPGV